MTKQILSHIFLGSRGDVAESTTIDCSLHGEKLMQRNLANRSNYTWIISVTILVALYAKKEISLNHNPQKHKEVPDG